MKTETKASDLIEVIEKSRKGDYLNIAKLYGSTPVNPPVNEAIKSYLTKIFGDEIEFYFKKTYPYHIITINLLIWSFTAEANFPLLRLHINAKDSEISTRNKAFEGIQKAAEIYSTSQGVIASNIGSAFYFDPDTDCQGKMKIYEIDIQNKKILWPVYIDGTYRKKIAPKERFSFKNIQDYIDARKGVLEVTEEQKKLLSKKEIPYQNQVIRWYIRTGLFNPLDTPVGNGERFLGNSSSNLLTEKKGKNEPSDEVRKEWIKIAKEQFDSSRKQNACKNSYIYNKEQNENTSSKKEQKDVYSEKQNTELDKAIDYIFSVFPKQIAAHLYTFDTGFFDLSQFDNTINDIYWLPLLTGKKDKPTGGVQYINVDKPLHISKNWKDLFYTCSILTHLFSGQFDDSQMLEIDYINEKTNANSAGVSIMSRNISHNIGSHVISYEKNALSSLELMLENGVLEGLLKKEGEKYYFSSNYIKREEDNRYVLNLDVQELKLPYPKAIGFFLGYLQERIEYTSAIASGSQFYYGKVHLLEDVCLQFLRYEHYKEGSLIGEPLIANQRNILLERIVLSEDYYKEDIEIYYNEIGCQNVEISLPTGIIGRQGIFAMLENIIRNTAKHGIPKDQRGGKIKIRIEVSSHSPEYYKLAIIDNSGYVAKEKLKTIQKSITDPLMINGKINEKQKGIKEIQIAAAWLRGVEPRDIEEVQREGEKNDRSVLTVTYEEPKVAGEIGGLKFEILIKKAKEVLLVEETPRKKKELPESWHSISWSDINSIVKATQYNFVLFDKSIQLENDGLKIDLLTYFEKKNTSLPVRCLTYDFNDINFKSLSKPNTLIEEEAKIYEGWLNKLDKLANNKNNKTKDLNIGIQDKQTCKKAYCVKAIAQNEETLMKETVAPLHIIHRIHNDTKYKFEDFQKRFNKLYEDAFFIEGISGNNSTNRIIRNEEKTRYWCKKMQESAACKIMIIDERIWNETTRPRQEEEGFNGDIEFEYNKNAKKQIYIYTIRADSNCTNFMQLIDLKNKPVADIQANGIITWIEEKPSFHFISFHQGLLDKIHAHFKINDPKDRQEFFKKMKASTDAALRYYFHSGRSSTPDLPKNTGFILLSSIDVALRDCKYRLTELLFAGALYYLNA